MILYYIRYNVVTPVSAAAFYTSFSVASVFAVTLCFLIQVMGMHIFPGMGSPWCFFLDAWPGSLGPEACAV